MVIFTQARRNTTRVTDSTAAATKQLNEVKRKRAEASGGEGGAGSSARACSEVGSGSSAQASSELSMKH